MLFNSTQFFFFFIIVTTLYFLLEHKYRWFLLLAASCYFYMAFVPIYILILGVTIVTDYIAGIYIESAKGSKRKLFLIMSLVANIGVLAIFKYYNFFADNINVLFDKTALHINLPLINILLPIGLSFHTFQAMSYTIEVYRGNQKAERNFGIYSLYVMFYPQLVAGPIERPQNLLYQFYEKHNFEYNRVVDGLKLMGWGLFKKVVIADRLAKLVNHVYSNPRDFNGIELIIASVFFSFQIYCDFSGYSDMAIGSAKVMGFKLMTNFNKPYFSRSISEFWKRWHISLSTWFKDYLYISLGGNRKGIPRWYLNLLIVFIVSGFWHGANWTFIVWGCLHGVFLISALLITKVKNKYFHVNQLSQNIFFSLPVFQVLITYFLVTIAWIFFRAANLSDAMYIVTHLFHKTSYSFSPEGFRLLMLNLGVSRFEFMMGVLLIIGLLGIEYLQLHLLNNKWFSSKPAWVRYSVYFLLIMTIITFGVFNQSQFIYFQF